MPGEQSHGQLRAGPGPADAPAAAPRHVKAVDDHAECIRSTAEHALEARGPAPAIEVAGAQSMSWKHEDARAVRFS